MPKDFRATMLERAIGRQLAGWRRQRDFSLAEASRRVGFSTAKLSLMENAVQRSAPVDVMALGYVYGVPTPEWQDLVRYTERAERRRVQAQQELRFDAAHDYAHLDAEVTRLRVFHNDLLPNLFRADEYALAVLEADDPLRAAVIAAQQTSVHVAWRARLRERSPLRVEAVFTEAVVRQVVGGRQVMKAQLQHLMEVSELPSVTVQIISCEAGAYPAMGSPFTLLSFPHQQHDDVVYLENFLKGEYVEDQRDCRRSVDRFAALQRIALPPAESRELIAEVVRDLS